jgi:GNAT superfamily N-acetyltransferase
MSCLLHGLRMRMANFSELLPCACMILRDEDLTPWLGGVFVGSHFRRRGIGAALCATVKDEARSRKIETLYLFTLDKQRGIHAWDGHYLLRAFGTNGPVT